MQQVSQNENTPLADRPMMVLELCLCSGFSQTSENTSRAKITICRIWTSMKIRLGARDVRRMSQKHSGALTRCPEKAYPALQRTQTATLYILALRKEVRRRVAARAQRDTPRWLPHFCLACCTGCKLLHSPPLHAPQHTPQQAVSTAVPDRVARLGA